MKIGALCEVIAIASHTPSQCGDLIVVIGVMGKLCVGQNLKTGKQHHYFTHEIKEVKQ